jgi:hypothetical protein
MPIGIRKNPKQGKDEVNERQRFIEVHKLLQRSLGWAAFTLHRAWP